MGKSVVSIWQYRLIKRVETFRKSQNRLSVSAVESNMNQMTAKAREGSEQAGNALPEPFRGSSGPAS